MDFILVQGESQSMRTQFAYRFRKCRNSSYARASFVSSSCQINQLGPLPEYTSQLQTSPNAIQSIPWSPSTARHLKINSAHTEEFLPDPREHSIHIATPAVALNERRSVEEAIYLSKQRILKPPDLLPRAWSIACEPCPRLAGHSAHYRNVPDRS